ncbi:VOC family protein [Rhodococcus sp. KRD197]|uniref:VOC family protein n=1 Tax=unclassified Rhodococcus (in: high G+C Gram-positive bacteria) TaxID=192944 RepID=UPI0027D9E2EF|nr:VOC family protein [Rhodococcus sp. KRD197]
MFPIVACRWRTASGMEASYCPEAALSISFDHTIIVSKDRTESASFFRRIFDLPEAPSWGFFLNVQLTDGTLVQFAEPPFDDIQFQHYAFRVDEKLFDSAYARLVEDGIEHWADPRMTQPGVINHGHGGRGVYFRDPTGHFLEMLTHSYLVDGRPA